MTPAATPPESKSLAQPIPEKLPPAADEHKGKHTAKPYADNECSQNIQP